MSTRTTGLVRIAIELSGVVQGVGFRPLVHNLATALGLAGTVHNRAGGLFIEVEGQPEVVERFFAQLTSQPPPLARIEQVRRRELPVQGSPGFRIVPSEASGEAGVAVAADAATCEDCLRELFDPADRRHRYPFINCTHCGPRLTIVREAPYDRASTTMAGFALCADCRREFEDPADRRFHAQPLACPVCGPRLALLDASGAALPAADPLAEAAARLLRGEIGAIKGLGGYHLACLASSEIAVATLRARKHREEKPFAVMVADLAGAERFAHLDDSERHLLASVERPIVLAVRRPEAGVAEGVAPGAGLLGLMLPSTPLQHLLLRGVQGAPLVMTSANRSDEPIAYQDAEALERLRGIADCFLAHDRPIQTRCDDSVARVVAGAPLLLRRARGYAPLPLQLAQPLARPTLALGGQLKATFALGEGGRAVVSHHLGDLDEYEALRSYQEALEHYQRLFRVAPVRLLHDLHPDYATTRLAQELAARTGAEVAAVQHHHAHFAGVLAEHGEAGPAIGVIFDGAGYGTDGSLWGGEFLVGSAAACERAAHLAVVGMPGGGRAAREGWRMALAHLLAAGEGPALLEQRVGAEAVRTAARLLERGLNCPPTSSVGRLFDAVACLAGGPVRGSYEGQVAAWLESAASRAPGERGAYPMALREREGTLVLDPAPLIREVVREAGQGAPSEVIAARFHAGLAQGAAEVCARLSARTGARVVALSGGVFANARLTRALGDRLRTLDLRLARHRRLPPGDGGLCWGQLAVAAARDGRG